jgi:hypothetical protein
MFGFAPFFVPEPDGAGLGGGLRETRGFTFFRIGRRGFAFWLFGAPLGRPGGGALMLMQLLAIWMLLC